MHNVESKTNPLFENSLAMNTFWEFERQGVIYCLWKSKDRFEEGIRGDTDLDVLVDKNSRVKLFQILKEKMWMRVIAESWRTFPDVYDFIGFEEKTGKVLHMHIHFQLVMGESGVKSLSLPWERTYFNNVITEHGVNFIRPELELIVLIIRISLKISLKDYVYASLFFSPRKIFRNMVSEYHELKEQCDRQLFERLLGSEQVKCIDNEILLSAYDDIYSYNHNKRWKIKKEIGKFRRYSELTVQYKKRKSYVEQRIYGVGKTMGEKNKRFAVCGPDGSGKTTLVIRIQKELGKHVLLDVVYMGGSPMSRKLPRKILRATIFPVYTILRRTLDLITLNNTAAVLRDRYYALEDRLITQEKIERYSGSLTKYQSGHFVLYERFPIFEKYGDGGEDESKIRLEQTVTLPDRVFVLMVEESDALLRKSDHDAIDLAKKIAAFRQFKASHKDNPQLSFIGPGLNEDAVFNQVMAEIFAELCSDN